MPESFNLTGFLLVMSGWIFSLCLHEFAHAVVAYYGGDTTVREKGYLSFNPLAYADPVNSLMWPLALLLLGGIGLPGGAVYVNRHLLRSRGWDCAVSLAGPLANVALLLFLMVPFWLGLVDLKNVTVMWAAYGYVCVLQVIAVLLNLLPVPPLDGFGAVSAYLDPLTRSRAYAMGHVGFIVLLVLLWGPFGEIFWSACDQVTSAVGIPMDLAEQGRAMMRIR